MFLFRGISCVLVVFAAGCGSWKIPVKSYSVEPPPAQSDFTAGAARIDITPPPGFPLGGHSIGGKVARGYWTRLYARAFFFRDKQGHALALVSCDLFAIPAGLHAEVARRIVDEHKISLVPDALVLAATHTHHGPGNFMSSGAYNFGGPIPGFSPGLFNFLAGKIAEAVSTAARQAAPAEIVLHRGFAPDIQRNRAIDAFYLNDRNDEEGKPYREALRRVLQKSKDGKMACPDGSHENCPRYLAADPSLLVLEVMRGQNRIGLLVFFAVHPTAMSHDSPLYSSDLAGRAMHLLERSRAPVAGFFNGAEGDISPRWVGQNRLDVLSLGDKLAAAVRRALADGRTSAGPPTISVARRQFRVNPPAAETAGLSSRPVFGVAAVAGAEDGRTLLSTYGWHGGVRASGGSDEKMPALNLHDFAPLEILQQFIAAPSNFPALAPLTVARLGSVLAVAAMPVEMTTVMGEKLRSDLEPLVRTDLALVGLANEYLSYCVSPFEYHAQDYEGSSTLFGRQEGPVISRLLQQVAGEPNAPMKQEVRAVKFNAGGKTIDVKFGPKLFGERRDVLEEELESVMPDAQWRVNSNAPRFEWPEGPADDWSAAKREVTIQVKVAASWYPLQIRGTPEDDKGSNLLTVLAEGTKDSRSWAAIWLAPGGAGSGPFRFRVVKPDGQAACSRPFRLDEIHNTAPTPSLEARKCEDE